jgi:hypothetical protein
MNETLAKRMEAHRAACADLENDPLLQYVFGKPSPQAPIALPVIDFTTRQAS